MQTAPRHPQQPQAPVLPAVDQIRLVLQLLVKLQHFEPLSLLVVEIGQLVVDVGHTGKFRIIKTW